MMKRVLALYIPFLSTDRLRNGRKGGACAQEVAPVVTIAPKGGVLRIVHVDRRAYEFRVRCGQTLADAKALAPKLVVFNDDPAADRRQLETLAIRADRFSPIVHLEESDTLFLDVTGCAHLFGGEEGLLHRVVKELDEQGFAACGAIADTPGAAWAIAHAHPESRMISLAGRTVADLALLPVWSLRVSGSTVTALHRVGIDTIGSLLHLPRSSLALRFGTALLDRIDQALGDVPEVLTPYRPPPVLKSSIRFAAPTDALDVLTEGLGKALERFCETLSRQVAGVCQMFVTFYCTNTPIENHHVSGKETFRRTVTFPVSLSQPTRSVKHLFSLLRVGLENLSLLAPAESLVLWARETEPLDDWQEELFTTDQSEGRALSDLVDCLSIRLGASAVVKAEPVSDHQPERAFRYVSATESKTQRLLRAADFNPRERSLADVAPKQSGNLRERAIADAAPSPFVRSRRLPTGRDFIPPAAQGEDDGALVIVAMQNDMRPLRLSPRPVEVFATAVAAEGPPVSFRFQGTTYAVKESVGPERIETGWWRGPHLRRDYYRVTTKDGCRAWLFRERDTSRWFLHGWFD